MPAFTALSRDNIQHNGDVLKAAVLTLAKIRDPALAGGIEDNGCFPNMMVDRITPVPTHEQIAVFGAGTAWMIALPSFPNCSANG